MRLFNGVIVPLAALASAAAAASSWSFEDATLTVQGKGTGVGGSTKEKYALSLCLMHAEVDTKTDHRLSPTSPLASAVTLGSADTLKIVLTTTEGKSSKKPHQAFLTLNEPATGLEESFAFSIKENGKGKVELVRQGMRCGRVPDRQLTVALRRRKTFLSNSSRARSRRKPLS